MSFCSCQLVEADLLVCMPAPGDGMKVDCDEIGKTFLYSIVTASQKSKNLIKTTNPNPDKSQIS